MEGLGTRLLEGRLCWSGKNSLGVRGAPYLERRLLIRAKFDVRNIQKKKMAAKFELPELLAVCIQTALNSGRRLSWKIQESVRGTLVQLVWKSDSPSRSLDALAPLAVTRPRKKSPSQIRRSQRSS